MRSLLLLPVLALGACVPAAPVPVAAPPPVPPAAYVAPVALVPPPVDRPVVVHRHVWRAHPHIVHPVRSRVAAPVQHDDHFWRHEWHRVVRHVRHRRLQQSENQP